VSGYVGWAEGRRRSSGLYGLPNESAIDGKCQLYSTKFMIEHSSLRSWSTKFAFDQGEITSPGNLGRSRGVPR
jgi:hypothetical protein